MSYMRDASGQRLDTVAVRQAASKIPPTNPIAGQEWLSSALVDLRFPTDPKLRQPILTHSLAWEAQALQEPSVWIANGLYNVLYTGGSGGLGYASCPVTADPTKAANWTKNATVVLAGFNHASVYVEGSTLYCYGNNASDNTVKVATASLSAPTVWTVVGTVATLPADANLFGNTFVVKDGSTYWMLLERRVTATGRWQIGLWSSTTTTGTFSSVVATLQSLWPDADHQTAGGPWLAKENGQWVLYYHCALNWNGLLPYDVYRATAPSLGADNFTITDANLPILRRVTAYEVDQVADVEVCRTLSGVVYAFWVGMQNRNTGSGFPGAIHCAQLVPTLKRWDGNQWATDSGEAANPPITTMVKPFVAQLATDFSGTATTFTTTGVAATRSNTGTDVEVELRAIVSITGAAGTKVSFQVTRAGGSPKPLGSIISDGTGNPVTIVGVAKYTMLTPGGASAGYTLQYKVSAGTLNCRPVTVADTEYMTLKVLDTAYP